MRKKKLSEIEQAHRFIRAVETMPPHEQQALAVIMD